MLRMSNALRVSTDWWNRGLIHTARSTAFWSALGCSVIALAQRAPEADPPRGTAAFELEWKAPRECVDAEQARAAIEQLLSPTAAEGTRAQVEVRIERADSGRFEAEIRVRRGTSEGERALSGESCARVTEAAALIVAMVLDPAGAARLAAVPPPPPPPPPAPPAREAANDGEEPEETGPSEPLRFSIGLRMAGDVGSLPRSTAGAGLGLGVRYAALQARIEALAWLPQDARAGPIAGSGATIGLYSAALRGCLDLADAFDHELALGGCVAAEAGLSTGHAVGISVGRAERGLWSAGLLGLFARQTLAASFELELMAELGLPLHRPTYGIDEFGPVFRASAVIARLELGVGWLFP